MELLFMAVFILTPSLWYHYEFCHTILLRDLDYICLEMPEEQFMQTNEPKYA